MKLIKLGKKGSESLVIVIPAWLIRACRWKAGMQIPEEELALAMGKMIARDDEGSKYPGIFVSDETEAIARFKSAMFLLDYLDNDESASS